MFVPIPIAVPVIGTLALALLSDATEERRRPHTYRKSIEVCTAQCSAQWIREDGVIRVYHEESQLECAQIVVEMTHFGAFAPPGDVEGYPVRVRLQG